MKVIGTVDSGAGAGKKFMTKDHYKDAFIEVLGWEPFAGTLNLIVSRDSTKLFCDNLDRIDGFLEKSERGETIERGSVLVRPVTIKLYTDPSESLEAAIVHPAKTMHEHILEIIAPVEIRDVWNVKDGDKIIVEY